LIGLVVSIYGLMQFFGKPFSDDVTVHATDQATATFTISPTVVSDLVVDIEGAVVYPGVYHFQTIARLQYL
jgi:hypothetical protein